MPASSHQAKGSSQRGLALLMVLVVLALASVIGVGLLERSQTATARTQALSDRWQAGQLSLGMEQIAQQALQAMLEKTNNPAAVVDLSQWSPPYEIPGGRVQGRLIDLGGRFNLNALTHPELATRLQALAIFNRLLEQLDLNPRFGQQLMNWLGMATQDAVNSPSHGKAPLIHVSELREMPGMDEAIYQTLLPWVAVLPSPELVININATRPEILASMFVAMDVAQAQRVLADGPYRSIESVWAQPILRDLNLSMDERKRLVVRSPWFLAHARVMFDRQGPGHTHHRFGLIQAGGSGYDFRYVSQGIP